MPLPKIDNSLMCKNGCDFYGHSHGYCSKCYREMMQKQRQAEKEKSSKSSKMAPSATLPRSERRSEPVAKSASFARFEEKRQKQSETLKRPHMLKLNVFKKAQSTDDHDRQEKPELKIPQTVFEMARKEFKASFPSLPSEVEKGCRSYIEYIIKDVMKHSATMTTDELSERVQRSYQKIMSHIEASQYFVNIDVDTRELLLDFIEKHSMSYLHEQTATVFSPYDTDDERLDRAMSERIQQLSWVCETHLECNLDRHTTNTTRLLYKAISELLEMDSCPSPGAKLSRVRQCCQHVVAFCSEKAPASADDLLPALIFTVLKANPPRLISNINFVSRFCNAQRLQTGEGGYYFTNLCCATSFIENLNAESLNMDKQDFDCYMSMPASIGGSSWSAALSLCAEQHEVEEQNQMIGSLKEQFSSIESEAIQLQTTADSFKNEIHKKVHDVLSRTPLEIKPRLPLPRYGQFKELEKPTPKLSEDAIESPIVQLEPVTMEPTVILEPEIEILQNPPKTDTTQSDYEQIWDLPIKEENSNLPANTELKEIPILKDKNVLTPSPVGFAFDSSIEGLTPDDYDNQIPLSSINYDIDLSDFSAENSVAEEKGKQSFSPESRDPFSPVPTVLKPDPNQFSNDQDPFSPIINQSDPFSPVLNQSDPFSPVHNRSDPFSPANIPHSSGNNPFSSELPDNVFDLSDANKSILDVNDSPTTAYLLPSPLLPQPKQE